MVGGLDDMRNQEVGIAGVGVRERLLGGCLEPVVEFFCDPLAEPVEQRLDVESWHQHAEQPAKAAELGEVADQRLPGARILDLYRYPGDRRAR